MRQVPENPIFCALDTVDLGAARALASGLAGLVGGVKVGKEFFTAQGPAGVRAVVGDRMPVFLDLKFHDIPNTVAGGVRAAAAGIAPFMLTVHAAGGRAMMRAAVEAAAEFGDARPLVLGITVLTSLDESDLADIGVTCSVADQVARLAALAQDSGLDGVVCSAQEIASLRAACGPDFKLVVPGIRPAGSAVGDQKRVMTPAEAIARGADYLVIGRPITRAADPVGAARAIGDEIRRAA